MKKIALILACAGLLTLPACNLKGSSDKDQAAQEEQSQFNDSLQTAIAEKDSLMMLMNEIGDGMNQIKEMEKLMSSSNLAAETPNKKAQIKNDMIAIQQALQERREKLDALEARLKKSTNYSEQMKATIANLKKQMEAQEATIADLQSQLQKANVQIAGLNSRVDSLTNVNTNVTREKQEAQEESVQLANQLNTCYYVVGSKQELKKYNIIETGFLRKTKIMEKDFEKSYFTKADKRTLSEIPLHAKNAKVLSKHPADSYTIETNNGVKTLKITNSTRFWELSNFLIVQI